MGTIKEKLRTGDVLHCEGNGFISKGIKFATRSNITHSAIVEVDENGVVTVYDSQKDGFNGRDFDEWNEIYKYKLIVTRPPIFFKREDISKRIQHIKGVTSYDFRLFCLRYPSKLIKSAITGKDIKLKAVKNEDDEMICSESIAYVLGIPNPEEYLPKTLLKYSLDRRHEIIE